MTNKTRRLTVFITGLVQGVGFRPAVWNLAHDMNLFGWVNNSTKGVNINVEGDTKTLLIFLERLAKEMPRVSRIDTLDYHYSDDLEGYTDFVKRESDDSGGKSALVIPDMNICEDCLRDIFNPDNRRYLYPFTNCTQCGPRYSIIKGIPYDRPKTTMVGFDMCPKCLEEYTNPRSRRFDAQPNACPDCGPQISLWANDGSVLAEKNEVILKTQELLRRGFIVAVKGLGGFHLMCDATNKEAVANLRTRKRRNEKAFALMYPSMYMLKQNCLVSAKEEGLLCSVEAPIVLLDRRSNSLGSMPAINVAPNGNPTLGVMLPYTPLHHILMYGLEFPVVATSGNISDEPMVVDEYEALDKLGSIADYFLVHDRPIHVAVDDSIARVVLGEVSIIRRARGYAPLPFSLGEELPPVLAVGPNQKNTVAITVEDKVFISPHNGDLLTVASIDHFEQSIKRLEEFYEIEPELVVCDKHPLYTSTDYAEGLSIPKVEVQHHKAHILACMAENKLKGDVLGVAFDGTGYGDDGTIWGGEFFDISDSKIARLAHLKTFPLIGGEAAIKDTARVAYALLDKISLSKKDLRKRALSLGLLPGDGNYHYTYQNMILSETNCPNTSSMGRLFDGVSALIGLCTKANYEGQAAMELEWEAMKNETTDSYSFDIELCRDRDVSYILDWRMVVVDILNDIKCGCSKEYIARKFHNSVISVVVGLARLWGTKQVALSGGCFLNKILLEGVVRGLVGKGFEPYWHKQIPTNDGGISCGQIMYVERLLKNEGGKLCV